MIRIVNILAYEKFSDALFEAGFNKLVEIAVENTLGIANFNISVRKSLMRDWSST